MTDREDLVDRTAGSIEGALDRALATPEGREAYDRLRRTGGTLSINGREISPETGEIASDGDTPEFDARLARIEGFVGDGDPDDRWDVPYGFGSVPLGSKDKRRAYLSFGEQRALADLAGALIERDSRLSPITTWDIQLTYRWGEDLGKEGSGLKLWRIRKPNPDVAWALGQCRPPRATDLLLDLNARVARHAEFTGWQVQAMLHEALGCLKLRGGNVAVEPLSDYWQEFILRRYGIWRPSLRALQAVMAAAEREQLPLWSDEDGEDE